MSPNDHAILSGASCVGLDPELWFSDSTADMNAAKRICNRCPVKDMCLAQVRAWEEDGERFGVFGGMSARQRRIEFGGSNKSAKADLCAKKLHVMDDDNVHVARGVRRCKACRLVYSREYMRLNGRKSRAKVLA